MIIIINMHAGVKPKTCQDFGCCYKNLSSDEFCKSVTVYNEKGEVQDPKRNCTNRSNCRKCELCMISIYSYSYILTIPY